MHHPLKWYSDTLPKGTIWTLQIKVLILLYHNFISAIFFFKLKFFSFRNLFFFFFLFEFLSVSCCLFFSPAWWLSRVVWRLTRVVSCVTVEHAGTVVGVFIVILLHLPLISSSFAPPPPPKNPPICHWRSKIWFWGLGLLSFYLFTELDFSGERVGIEFECSKHESATTMIRLHHPLGK